MNNRRVKIAKRKKKRVETIENYTMKMGLIRNYMSRKSGKKRNKRAKGKKTSNNSSKKVKMQKLQIKKLRIMQRHKQLQKGKSPQQKLVKIKKPMTININKNQPNSKQKHKKSHKNIKFSHKSMKKSIEAKKKAKILSKSKKTIIM